MKTKVLKVFMLCAVMITALHVSLSAQEDDVLKKMAGEWTYTMPDMGGGGAMDGKCIIATVNGETKATLSTPMGDITSSALKLENGKYVGNMDIPDFDLGIALYFKEDVLMQEILSGFGDIVVEMKRAK
ncbi:MAG: hypothetical protein LBB84_07235 [Tannerellaceae bacterium]|jgi:hypothetical protein|nr:hypothetical protein [Tannerellaceae bacterium]